VHAPETNTTEVGGGVKDFLLRLAPLLIRAGLQVSLLRGGMVEVRNPRGSAGDPLGRAMSPGMRQQIALGDRDGILWWFWVWSGPARDTPPEFEPICVAADVEQVATRLAKVLHAGEPAGS